MALAAIALALGGCVVGEEGNVISSATHTHTEKASSHTHTSGVFEKDTARGDDDDREDQKRVSNKRHTVSVSICFCLPLAFGTSSSPLLSFPKYDHQRAPPSR